jgi:hypothetical protein
VVAAGSGGTILSSSIPLTSGTTSQVVTLPFVQPNATYPVVVSIENLIDTNTQFIPLTITNKTTTNFTVTWNNSLPDGNYSLDYLIPNGVTSAIGVTDVTHGGTGQTTAAAAFNAISPLTTKGDILVYSTTNTRLPVSGTNGQALIADSTQATGLNWGSVFANPMTTGGDIIYGGASGAATRLANGTAGQVLTSSGTTVAPTWKGAAGQVQCSYADSTGQSITSSVSNFTFNTLQYDNFSMFNGTTGTIPVAGLYRFTLTMKVSGLTTASSFIFSNFGFRSYPLYVNQSNQYQLIVDFTHRFAVSDTFTIPNNFPGNAGSVDAGVGNCYFSMIMIGP